MLPQRKSRNDGSLLALIKANLIDGRGNPCNDWQNAFNLKETISTKLKKKIKPQRNEPQISVKNEKMLLFECGILKID